MLTVTDRFNNSWSSLKKGHIGGALWEGAQGLFRGIGSFFGSAWKEASEGFSQGGGREEEKRKEEEAKAGDIRSLTPEELDEQTRKESMSFFSQSKRSVPRRITSSMMLTGAYSR